MAHSGDGSVTDPMVSFDGQWVYYTHIHYLQKYSEWNPPLQGAETADPRGASKRLRIALR